MRLLCILSALFLLSACSSKAAKDAPSETDPRGLEPWFCQVGDTDEKWDCVRSEPLAETHQPTRLPAPRQQNTANVEQPLPRPKPAPGARPISAPNPVAKTQVTKPSAPASKPPPPSVRTQSKDVPVHIALSYKPPKPTPILDLPGDFFAVQLVAVSTKEALEDFAKKHKIKGMSAARTYNGEQLFYVLLLGIYETRANAMTAVASLAPPFDKMTPWIRSLGSLQQSMLEADKVAGTTDI